MFKYLRIVSLAVMILAPAAMAETINKVVVDVAVGTGVNADFDAATGVLTWSQGASGYLLDTGGLAYPDSDIDVSARFTNAVDNSSGGSAMATFMLDYVTITFNSFEFPSLTGGGTSKAVFTLSPYGAGLYNESEVFPDVLQGQAVVGVSAVFTLEPLWGSEFIWDGVNDVSLLDAIISLPFSTNFQSYQSNYSSDNNAIVLNANEVPEPCTMVILGLGGLLLRRRLA